MVLANQMHIFTGSLIFVFVVELNDFIRNSFSDFKMRELLEVSEGSLGHLWNLLGVPGASLGGLWGVSGASGGCLAPWRQPRGQESISDDKCVKTMLFYCQKGHRRAFGLDETSMTLTKCCK